MVDWIKTVGTLSFMAKGAIINTYRYFPIDECSFVPFFFIWIRIQKAIENQSYRDGSRTQRHRSAIF